MNTKLTIDGYKNITQNKYLKWYRNIILNRLTNPVETSVYSEKHHILPKSLGGTNNIDNIIILTAKEHYITHLLLIKFVTGNSYYKMLCAFNSMNMKSKYTIDRYQNSKLYKQLKEEYATEVSNHQLKVWSDPEYKELMKQKAKISWLNGSRDKQLEYMRNNSPFKIKEIHEKTIKTRTDNKTNIWITNNPMKDPKRAKEIASSRSGKNHYLRKTRKYYYKKIDDDKWIEIDCINGLTNGLMELDFSYATFMMMLKDENYKPKRGTFAGIEVKRIIL